MRATLYRMNKEKAVCPTCGDTSISESSGFIEHWVCICRKGHLVQIVRGFCRMVVRRVSRAYADGLRRDRRRRMER
jgi:hypothetical protein